MIPSTAWAPRTPLHKQCGSADYDPGRTIEEGRSGTEQLLHVPTLYAWLFGGVYYDLGPSGREMAGASLVR